MRHDNAIYCFNRLLASEDEFFSGLLSGGCGDCQLLPWTKSGGKRKEERERRKTVADFFREWADALERNEKES